MAELTPVLASPSALSSSHATPAPVSPVAGVPVGQSAAPRSAGRGSWLTGAVLPLALLVLWEVLARVGYFPPNLLPAPSKVPGTIWQLALTGELWQHLGITLYRVVLGFVLGGALATVHNPK